MNDLGHALLGTLWPPSSPVFDADADPRADRLWWRLHCALLIVPFTAIWHHAVFYSPRCMLNDFGPEYTPDVVGRWLSRDPSLPWAVVVALLVYAAGNRWRLLRILAAPLFLAFLPLSVWIWDIPFTGRVVCHWGHDKKPVSPFGFVMRTRYLYLLGAGAYVVLLVAMLARLTPRRQPRKPLAP